jgi:hypothetical protein
MYEGGDADAKDEKKEQPAAKEEKKEDAAVTDEKKVS